MNTREKAEEYSLQPEGFAMSFFFSFTPDDWGFEELTTYLRKTNNDTVYDMACDLNREDELSAWEVFEEHSPHWLADQLEMMATQLTELFKEQA